ncbi:hypothetical protein J2045_002940 [Peteryoungia aggregata LMG 23059]|uniref:Uncharacterized protein n=1 Tax=Peteryoungia aggregata LMG 23059 TaxID=1368425 RepID=A0ABU0GB07_9HYPH|nr:hypothetical protein [Peteryoungia aggregata]MDQ0421896.1 hypothetical protein [Peteryoungia aggregata LMG 23059]
MKILFLLACACVIAATIGAVAIGLSLFTQPEAYAGLRNAGEIQIVMHGHTV